MQCPNCQHEMLTSKIGMLCLGCGHVQSGKSKAAKAPQPAVSPVVPVPPPAANTPAIGEIQMAAPEPEIVVPALPDSPLQNTSPHPRRRFHSAFAVTATLLIIAGGAFGYQQLVLMPKQALEKQVAEQARVEAEAQARIQAEAAAAAMEKAEAAERDEQRKADLKAISDALAAYAKNNANRYPAALSSLSTRYLATIPTDPTTKKAYTYTTADSRREFTLAATLEVKDDPKATNGTYQVKNP